MSESDIWEGTVLTVPNRHVKGCGKPPELRAGKGYTAYFENILGEQLVFTYDWHKKKGLLWHGDVGWDSPCEVTGGIPNGVILSGEEQSWLNLVWKVGSSHPYEEGTVSESHNGHGDRLAKSFYNLERFSQNGILVSRTVRVEMAVRLLAAIVSTDLNLAGVDYILKRHRDAYEEAVKEEYIGGPARLSPEEFYQILSACFQEEG